MTIYEGIRNRKLVLPKDKKPGTKNIVGFDRLKEHREAAEDLNSQLASAIWKVYETIGAEVDNYIRFAANKDH